MGNPYSMDLRERVDRAVEIEGLSRHGASRRFPDDLIRVISSSRHLLLLLSRQNLSNRLVQKMPGRSDMSVKGLQSNVWS